MAVVQPAYRVLIYRYRGQAPSHIWRGGTPPSAPGNNQITRTLSACGPFWPSLTSYPTFWPS